MSTTISLSPSLTPATWYPLRPSRIEILSYWPLAIGGKTSFYYIFVAVGILTTLTRFHKFQNTAIEYKYSLF